MKTNSNSSQTVGLSLIALAIFGWIVISVVNEFRQAPWPFIGVLIAFVGWLITYAGNLQLQIRNEQIEKKTQIYEELVHFLFEILFAEKISKSKKSEQEIIEFLVGITPKLIMYASDATLKSFIKFRMALINENNNSIVYLGEILLNIRQDLGHNNNDLKEVSILEIFTNIDELEQSMIEAKNQDNKTNLPA
ncbi:MAG TPA: hypothetical protein VK203_27815 [Nostocaceae cyanobacterium]|nr:hypothetical protein [Nostocaceae cyanobacterium]